MLLFLLYNPKICVYLYVWELIIKEIKININNWVIEWFIERFINLLNYLFIYLFIYLFNGKITYQHHLAIIFFSGYLARATKHLGPNKILNQCYRKENFGMKSRKYFDPLNYIYCYFEIWNFLLLLLERYFS